MGNHTLGWSYFLQVKVKCTLVQGQRLCTGSTLYSFLTTTLEGVRGQLHAPAALNPRGRPGTHCTGEWVGPRAGLDVRKISHPPGFDTRTVQPVVSRYTD